MFFRKEKKNEIVFGNPSRRYSSDYALRKKIFINAYSQGYYSNCKNLELIEVDENYQVKYLEKIKFLAHVYDHPKRSVLVDSTHLYYINDQNRYIYSELVGNSINTYQFQTQTGWLAHIFTSGLENDVIENLNSFLKTEYEYEADLNSDQDFLDRISLPIKEFVKTSSIYSDLKYKFGRANIGEALIGGYEMEIVGLLNGNERYSGSISWNLMDL